MARKGGRYCPRVFPRCVIFVHFPGAINPTWALRREVGPRVTILPVVGPFVTDVGVRVGSQTMVDVMCLGYWGLKSVQSSLSGCKSSQFEVNLELSILTLVYS